MVDPHTRHLFRISDDLCARSDAEFRRFQALAEGLRRLNERVEKWRREQNAEPVRLAPPAAQPGDSADY
jgi:hypothetical protein